MSQNVHDVEQTYLGRLYAAPKCNGIDVTAARSIFPQNFSYIEFFGNSKTCREMVLGGYQCTCTKITDYA